MTDGVESATESPAPALVPDRGGALSFPVVSAIFGTLLVLGVALGLAIHRSYVGFARVVAYHVPPDVTLALRWDIEKVGLFEPTRRFLLPLLDEVHPPPPAPSTAPEPRSPLIALLPSTGPVKATPPGRRDSFAAESGSMIGRDLREVLVLFGPADGDWAVVLGAAFPKGDMVAAVARTFEKEGWPWRDLGKGRLASPGGAAIGRAEDGAFVIASSVARLDAVLPVRELSAEIQRTGAGSLRLEGGRAGLPAGAGEMLAGLGHFERVVGNASFGSPLPIELTVQYGGPPPADVTTGIHRTLERLLGDDLARLEHVYGPIKFRPEPLPTSSRQVTVSLLVDDMALERAAKRGAEAVESTLANGPAQE
ncbi:MAG TPA: hypothetical protein VMI54_17235 [Polyangiaceae bacterium]|nr:hypothetical protein [Polyangiaceae bacterium]